MKIADVEYNCNQGVYFVLFEDGTLESFKDGTVWELSLPMRANLATELEPQKTIAFFETHLDEIRLRSIPRILE